MSGHPSSPPPTFVSQVTVKVVELVNRTTRMEIRGGKRFFGDKEEKDHKDVKLEFVEFAGDGIKLDVPARSCADGHRLQVEIHFKTPTETFKIHAEGIVEHAEHFADLHDCIRVRLTHYENDVWADVLKLYRQRQRGVADLFDRLKGGDR